MDNEMKGDTIGKCRKCLYWDGYVTCNLFGDSVTGNFRDKRWCFRLTKEEENEKYQG